MLHGNERLTVVVYSNEKVLLTELGIISVCLFVLECLLLGLAALDA